MTAELPRTSAVVDTGYRRISWKSAGFHGKRQGSREFHVECRGCGPTTRAAVPSVAAAECRGNFHSCFRELRELLVAAISTEVRGILR